MIHFHNIPFQGVPVQFASTSSPPTLKSPRYATRKVNRSHTPHSPHPLSGLPPPPPSISPINHVCTHLVEPQAHTSQKMSDTHRSPMLRSPPHTHPGYPPYRPWVHGKQISTAVQYANNIYIYTTYIYIYPTKCRRPLGERLVICLMCIPRQSIQSNRVKNDKVRSPS